VNAMVLTEHIGRVLVATLSRPPVNAIDDRLIAELDAVLDRAIDDDGVAVLHLRSDQRAFSAGADLTLMQACFATADGADAMTDVVRNMQRLYLRLEAAPVVTLAEIATTALGGGFELALACDLRVAAHEAKLGLPEARLGLLPGAGGTQRLTRLCGPGLAKRLILGAEIIDGVQAERLGLVQWAAPTALLPAFAAELAQRYAAMPKAALAANKRCIAASMQAGRDGYAEEICETRTLYGHPETRRKVSDFLSQRSR
jgi:enoyl-CoA hydratase